MRVIISWYSNQVCFFGFASLLLCSSKNTPLIFSLLIFYTLRRIGIYTLRTRQDKLTSSEKNLSTFLFSKFLRERRISAIGGKRLASNIKLGKMNKLVAPVYKTIKQRRSGWCFFLAKHDNIDTLNFHRLS